MQGAFLVSYAGLTSEPLPTLKLIACRLHITKTIETQEVKL